MKVLNEVFVLSSKVHALVKLVAVNPPMETFVFQYTVDKFVTAIWKCT